MGPNHLCIETNFESIRPRLVYGVTVYNRYHGQEIRRPKERLKKFLVWAAVLEIVLMIVLQPLRPVLIIGESMQPTLNNFQVVIARPIGVQPLIGDVVICDWSDEMIVKRVAGLEFDAGMPGQPAKLRVPSSHVYILGDNSKNSVDSRYFGPLPNRDVKMLVVFPQISNAR